MRKTLALRNGGERFGEIGIICIGGAATVLYVRAD